MAKTLKNYRLENSTIRNLEKLVALYTKLDIYNGKKVTATDVVELLIQKETETLKKEGYTL